MIKIKKEALPNGGLSPSLSSDMGTRRAIVLFNENIKSLKKQLSTVQDAVMELQQKVSSTRRDK